MSTMTPSLSSTKIFRVDLYDVVNRPSVPVGEVGEATVTIMFDDADPPAGSVDQFYNPDFGLDLIPAVNGSPISTEPRQFPGTELQSQSERARRSAG